MTDRFSKLARSSPTPSLAALLLVLALLPLGPGCRSTSGPGSASFASVTIENRTMAEIAATTAQVFGEDGYRGGRSGSNQMIFDKEASRATSLAREGIVDSQAGAQTINRVRVEIVPLSTSSHRPSAKLFLQYQG